MKIVSIVKSSILLYDGIFEDGLQHRQFTVGEITFRLSELLEMKLEKLAIPATLWAVMADTLDFQSGFDPRFAKYFIDLNHDKVYRSEGQLDLYVLESEHKQHIFSFGEKQPGRCTF